MNKLIWVLACLLIADWIFDFQMTQWKIEEFKTAAEETKAQLQAIKAEVNEVKQLQQIVQTNMKDPSKWTQLIEQLNTSSNPVPPPQ